MDPSSSETRKVWPSLMVRTGGPTVTSKAMLIVSGDEVPLSDDFTSAPLAWWNQSDNRLAGTAIAHRFTRVRCRCLSEWKHRAHDGPQLAGVQHRRDVAQLSSIGLDK